MSAKGPDVPQAVSAAQASLPPWSAGWHDHLQYHFFFDGLFVQARIFLTPSLEETSLWIFDHKVGKVEELLNSPIPLEQDDSKTHLHVTSPQLTIEDGPGGGSLSFRDEGGAANMELEFTNRHVFSWVPAGQTDEQVIHRPDLDVELKFRGRSLSGRGYSKRYWGIYGPHWGYRFIQSSSLGGRYFLWTADATFRLGHGEAKYNYFKLLDGETGELIQADSPDTYQQDSQGFAMIHGDMWVATVTPLGQWMHDYKAGDTNSRMQLRYCKVHLVSEGPDGIKESFEGYALNERCFGVL